MRSIIIEKPKGITPLEALSRFREKYPKYASVPLSYAGRLDPMASGKLLVLLGDECKKQKKYTGLDKEYEIQVLLDCSTDTGDLLGLPQILDSTCLPGDNDIRQACGTQIGAHTVPYPVFSSKTVGGKPLFMYALSGTAESIEVPLHTETIYSIVYLGQEVISRDDLKERIQTELSIVPRSSEPSKILGADFRQDSIRAQWGAKLDTAPKRTFCILRIRVICGSGTYMRTLAQRIGEALGTTGVAYSIHRTRIGHFIRPLHFFISMVL